MSQTRGDARRLGLATLSEWLRAVRRTSRRLWVRVLVVASVGPLSILLAQIIEPWLPEGSASAIGAQSLGNLLDIMASSLLTVTTFSLSAMVAVQFAASGQITHRAQRSLLDDTTTQTVLATYVGGWIYALTSIVVIATPYFGERELVALFLVTILVLSLIVAVTLRWIIHLQTLGSLVNTADDMEREALEAIRTRVDLFTHPLAIPGIPDDAVAVRAQRTGYVQYVGERSLQSIAERAGGRVWLLASPGRFVIEGQVIARMDPADEDAIRDVAEQICLGHYRTTEQDPRFAVIQLAEIAAKALSPGVNDQGTAIDVLGRLGRVLMAWIATDPDAEPILDRVWALPVEPSDVVSDAFDSIARDGAGQVEVQVTLQKRIAGLLAHGDPALHPALEDAAQDAFHRSIVALRFEGDRARLRAARAEGVRE